MTGGLDALIALKGNWQGTYRLWESPAEPSRDSKSALALSTVARGKFVRMDYSWAYSREPHDGSLLFGHEAMGGTVIAAWIDSWHNDERMMICRGTVDSRGIVTVLGTYPAPPDPDWGWRTVVEPTGRDRFRVVMYNVSPQGREGLAVEATYTRVPSRGPRKRSA